MLTWSVGLVLWSWGQWVFYMLLPLFCLEMEEMLDVFGLKMLALSLQAVDPSHVKSMPAHSQGQKYSLQEHYVKEVFKKSI